MMKWTLKYGHGVRPKDADYFLGSFLEHLPILDTNGNDVMNQFARWLIVQYFTAPVTENL